MQQLMQAPSAPLDDPEAPIGCLTLGARAGDTICLRPSGDPETVIEILGVDRGLIRLRFRSPLSTQILRGKLASRIDADRQARLDLAQLASLTKPAA